MSEVRPVHSRLQTVESHNAELVIGGQSVTALALRAGQTPFYAYDRTAIATRITDVRNALPKGVKVHYAVKANPMPALLGHVRPLVDGFDVASEQEIRGALDAGMPAEEISFAGPAKRYPELECAVGAGICINCESETELERLRDISNKTGRRARVAIRVNPDFEMRGAGVKMSGSAKQFGIDADRVPAAMRIARDFDLALEGLHIYCGSQNLRTATIIEANKKTLSLAAELCARSENLRFINIGGGYGIPYFPGETPIDLSAIGNALDTAISTHRGTLGDTAIVVELGRYLVGEAGYYVCRVQDIKISQGQQFVMVDGGLHHHLSNSGNFGQVLRKNYPVVIGNRIGEDPDTTASIVGPLCTPLDIVAEKIAIPTVTIGDLVVVMQSGAYGYSASPMGFLSHPVAIEILV